MNYDKIYLQEFTAVDCSDCYFTLCDCGGMKSEKKEEEEDEDEEELQMLKSCFGGTNMLHSCFCNNGM